MNRYNFNIYIYIYIYPNTTKHQSKPQVYKSVNTDQGLYQYARLQFGVASAPAMFQRLMNTILQGVPGTICYINDILVTRVNEAIC